MGEPDTSRADRYLIIKRDLYYRPDNCGYTGIKDEAGRYTRAEAELSARPGNGVSFIHEDDAPDYTKACFDDLKAQHLEGKLRALLARAERAEAERDTERSLRIMVERQREAANAYGDAEHAALAAAVAAEREACAAALDGIADVLPWTAEAMREAAKITIRARGQRGADHG